MKAVPGQKIDVKDAEWIANILQPSHISGRDQRELRALARYLKSLVGERTRELNLHKSLFLDIGPLRFRDLPQLPVKSLDGIRGID